MDPLSHISPKAAVRPSPIHGLGLFATGPFDAGEIVAVKGGHIFTGRTRRVLAPALGPAEIQIAEDLFIGPVRKTDRRGGMIFSNHSCDPTIGVQGQIVFVALRDLRAGED
ncbi:MAG: SET domain-containing protein-lysine N-methyltransferase, partial [Acidobacteriota bacterium]